MMEIDFLPSTMTTPTPVSRSKRPLRRTFSTRPIGLTVGEIALLEGLTVVYKSSIDLYFYVIGSSYENELMLMAVLNCLFDSLSQMLRKNVEKRALLENMEGLFLAVDEIVDGGVILESDPQQVVHRVALRGEDVPLTEQTVSQVLQSAKEQIKWSLLR
ncbi:coatomer subunit zeta-1 isoform X3 [Carlito syrichta]|uniref:Coatomer subunit zeta n=1 Tax=Carlito syrichta TaxID=1868482 RepID=A0A3Q0E4Y4_CARSF|nr:PREDICTED: coatomer subunit zeta-1 isoform X4 [Colobus angolensis palliatus]XP_021569335.1 coatomer subunit zeta-1 isoform X3 [Carlito syrichta]